MRVFPNRGENDFLTLLHASPKGAGNRISKGLGHVAHGRQREYAASPGFTKRYSRKK